jgi:hypothetical protein
MSNESIYIISHPRSKIAIRDIINHISGNSATRTAGKSERDSEEHPGKEMIRFRGRQTDMCPAKSMIQLAVIDTEKSPGKGMTVYRERQR